MALLHSDTPQELKYADTLQSVTHTITIKIAAHFFLLFQNIFDNFFVRVDKKPKTKNFNFNLNQKKEKKIVLIHFSKRFIVRYGTFPTALLINRCGLYDGSVGTIRINVPESRIKR